MTHSSAPHRTALRAWIAIFMALALTAAVGSSANANANANDPIGIRTEQGMSVIGFDPDIAIANGADVRYDAEGQPYLVDYPQALPLDAEGLMSGVRAEPIWVDDRVGSGGFIIQESPVYGDCGYSWIDI